MSSALSNLTPTFSVSPLHSHSRRRMRLAPANSTFKAMADDARENLDHLQRASKQQVAAQQQQQPRRRIAQSAPLGLWDRFPAARTIQQMMDTMDRIMEDPVAYSAAAERATPAALLASENGNGYRRGRTPWEIKEKEGDYKLRFDMPGMTKKDVRVWVEEKMLVIKAEKLAATKKANGAGENGEEEEEWSASSYGKYNTRIALPENVEIEKIKAEVKDGVLYITIPKAQAASKVLDIDVQ